MSASFTLPSFRGIVCAGIGCETPVLAPTRFCNACFAEAAKAMACQLETDLIRRRGVAEQIAAESLLAMIPTSDPQPVSAGVRAALPLEPRMRPLEWYETESPLGKLYLFEALYLRALVLSACELVSLGGVATLENLPGTPRNPPPTHPSAPRPQPKKGRCDFRKLPQHTATEPAPAPWRQDLDRRELQYAAASAAVMIALGVLAVLR